MRQYGLNDHFQVLAGMYPEYAVGRITSQEKGFYQLVTSQGEKRAEVSGKFRYHAVTVSDYPAVGDFVMVNWNDHGGNAVIHHVLHRKSCVIRKAAGNAHQEQVVAANIDTIFLCMSLNNDFNLRRLERYLSIAWDSGAVPVVVLTKADLCGNLEEKQAEVASVAIGVDVLVSTALEKDGYRQILPYITDGKTVAFIGSSGVGKSTLINCLLGEQRLDTNGLRNDDKGRHTTTHRELILLPNGGLVIDTPGMRELGMWDVTEGLSEAFEDVEQFIDKCRFRDCNHENEPGCAVRKAIENGELDLARFESYKKLKTEAKFRDDGYDYKKQKQQWEKSLRIGDKKKRKERF